MSFRGGPSRDININTAAPAARIPDSKRCDINKMFYGNSYIWIEFSGHACRSQKSPIIFLIIISRRHNLEIYFLEFRGGVTT